MFVCCCLLMLLLVSAVIDKVKQVQALERSLVAAHESCGASFKLWSESEARKARCLGGYSFDSRQSTLLDFETVANSAQRTGEIFAAQVVYFHSIIFLLLLVFMFIN